MRFYIFILLEMFSLVHLMRAGLVLDEVKALANHIGDKTKILMKTTTKYEELEREYENLLKSKTLSIKTLNVSKVSEEFSTNLKKLLMTHMNSVMEIKNKAEELNNNYTYDKNIQPFNYYNRKNNPENFVQWEHTFSKTRKVNINRSYVQVPTDIYKYHKYILNDAKWSEGIDDVFRKNLKNIPSLLWQYFGSENGMFRSFPGKNEKREIDLYDCRRRLWYNQAINSPKDVVVIVDLSGSMTGSHFDIAKVTIKSIINTLQQNDFFNVIYFLDGKVNLIRPCWKLLQQATSQNKEALKTAVDRLKRPSGVSNVDEAFDTAFKVLEKSRNSDLTSTRCTQAIMIVTDEIERSDEMKKTLQRLNAKRDIVIFSYIVGTGGKTAEEVKRIACANGGSFYHFPTVGNVWNGVLQYQKVLSKPIAQEEKENIIFTPLYLDSGDLGMMTTISAPVFGKVDNSSQRKLLGVAGVDIRVTLLEQQYPITKLGVFGHAFAINNNGLFLIHPKFQDQTGYLPDPATVFLNEVEHTVIKEASVNLTSNMIDERTGCMAAELDWLYLKTSNTRVVRLNMTYCYQPITGTPFRTGVSISFSNQKVLSVSELKYKTFFKSGVDGLNTTTKNKYIEIAAWMFCDIPAKEQENEPASFKFYPKAEELQRYLAIENKYTSNCDEEMLSNLLLSSSVVSNFTEREWSIDKLQQNHITNVYIITSSGYVTSLTALVDQDIPINRNFLADELYARSASFVSTNRKRQLVFSVPIKEINKFTNRMHDAFPVNVSLSSAMYISKDDVIVGVTGMTISSDYLLSILHGRFQNSTDPANSTYCQNSVSFKCYLIDENGYVVTSNQGKDDLGVFFGFVNGLLMRKFVSLGIYSANYYDDTQAKCEQRTYTATSSANRKSSSQLFLDAFIRIFNMFVPFFIHQTPATEFEVITKNISCTKRIVIYKRTEYKQNYSDYFECSNQCNSHFAFVSLMETNIALVTISNNCSFPCLDYVLSNEPIKLDYSDECPGRSLQFRKSLSLCHRLRSDNVECSSAKYDEKSTELKSYLTVILSFLVFFVLVIFITCF